MADVEKLLDVAPYLKYPSDESPTTEQQYQDFVKNVHTTLANTLNTVKLWQPSTAYAADEIISSPNMQPNTVAKVTTAGTSNNIEPTWTAAGTTVEDNGCTYLMVRKCQESATADEAKAGTDTMKIVTPAALAAVLADFKKQVINAAHPVGEIWETTTGDDPNKLWSWQKWVKMDAGRVLVSAGTYTENGTSYTYTLGATGGEAKHTITISEIASHNHGASISTANLTGTWSASGSQGLSNSPSNSFSGIISGSDWSGDTHSGSNGNNTPKTITINASHSHSVTINTTGNGSAHENRMPYTVVNRWKRTA
jgi:microcystin-dependent protein